MLYYRKDWNNITRDYFEHVFLFDFLALQLTIGASVSSLLRKQKKKKKN